MLKNLERDVKDPGSIPRLGRSPWKMLGTIRVFLPGESHGQRILAAYNPKGWNVLDMSEVKKSDMTEVT